MMRTLLLFAVLITGFTLPSAFADDGLAQRLVLSKKIQELRPVKTQVDNAIDRYVSLLPPEHQAAYHENLSKVINYKALERASIDAYAQTYTLAELTAMYEYYKKPESLSAANKASQYASQVLPEIIRMLDKEMMRLRAGG